MATSIARPYHTLGHHQLAKNPGRRKCRCCPYGYHIDVDFVRYCETIADSQVLSDLPVRKSRWNVRKRRASKETLLGIANATQLSEDISKASQDVGDDLQKAVMDFEQVLTSTTVGRSTTLPRRKEFLPKFENHEKLINTINKNLNNHNVSTKYISAPIEEVILHVDDLECPGMNNASPQMLQSIRKQMAASLGRMKELEEQVKLIPNLQAHISNLENENQKLNLMLKDKIETLNQLQYKKKCIDATTSTNCLNYHTRNIGVSCTIMTRDIGINSSVKMATSATETIRLASLSEKLETAGQSRPCLISLENILGNGSKSNLKHVSTTTESSKVTKDATTETDINSKKLFTEDEVAKRVQKIENNFENRRRSNRKNIALLTDLKLDQIYTQEDLNRSLAKANQAIIAKKVTSYKKIFTTDVPLCESCGCVVRPDIVFFGEALPAKFYNYSAEDFGKCDLLIVMGSSLTVEPFASLVRSVKRDCPRIVINDRPVGHTVGISYSNHSRDVFIEGSCDDGCRKLAATFGWTEDYERLLDEKHITA
uniref:Deacetylase sirtuin-type domain-containing protein n=1 Tax=Rhodnius prolixus TaxID=13249 RepID=T1HVQ6_RHOPR